MSIPFHQENPPFWDASCSLNAHLPGLWDQRVPKQSQSTIENPLFRETSIDNHGFDPRNPEDEEGTYKHHQLMLMYDNPDSGFETFRQQSSNKKKQEDEDRIMLSDNY